MNSQVSGFRTMLLFLVVTHFVLHTYTQLIPALLPTLQRELGVSLVQVSLLVSIPMMVNVVANIPAGIISDRIGPKIFAASFLVNIVGAFLIIISGEFYLLLLGAAFISAASTFYHPLSLKSASLIDPSKMNMALAAHLAGGTSGIATGPIILGVLMPIFGWRSAFLAWIPLNLILSVISYRIIGKFKDISKERSVSKTSVLNSVKVPPELGSDSGNSCWGPNGDRRNQPWLLHPYIFPTRYRFFGESSEYHIRSRTLDRNNRSLCWRIFWR
jgi:MFS family permease